MLNWFRMNSMKANPGKFQFIGLGAENIAPLNSNFASKIISSFSEVKLLEITIDNQLKFKKNIEDLCKKVFFKLHFLWRIRRCLADEKASFLANAFIDCQFDYALFALF